MRSFKINYWFIGCVTIGLSVLLFFFKLENEDLGENLVNLSQINVAIAIGLAALSLTIKSKKEKLKVIREIVFILLLGILTLILSMFASTSLIEEGLMELALKISIILNTLLLVFLVFLVGKNLINTNIEQHDTSLTDDSKYRVRRGEFFMKNITTIGLIMIPTIIFGAKGNTVEMGLVLFAGIVAGVFLNLDKFEAFKISTTSLEGKLAKAEKIIDDANVTIKQLKSISGPLLSANLNLLIYDGIFDGMETKDKEKIYLELMSIINELDLELDNDMLTKAVKYIAAHHFSELRVALDSDTFNKKYYVYGTPKKFPETPPIDEVEEFLNENSIHLVGEAKQKFEGFKNFSRDHLMKLS